MGWQWPLPNVWLGTSVEDQSSADKRVPLLLQTPAAVRWLSIEPLLREVGLLSPWLSELDWVVVGGESGHEARPMHPQWARNLRDQCIAYGVPFFFKQWGEWVQASAMTSTLMPSVLDCKRFDFDDGEAMYRVGKRAAGRLLDGREWNEYPQVIA